MVDEAPHPDQPAYAFYTTLGCHLCEEAARVLQEILPVDGVTVQEIDIAHSEALMAQYGHCIPVLKRHADGHELHWPFTIGDVHTFLATRSGNH